MRAGDDDDPGSFNGATGTTAAEAAPGLPASSLISRQEDLIG